ncbi:hypothetical protein Zmor_012731 [Zophobas morio]|uniref:Uncharacterized protein n=1 Tax=Zophobas morio TaxID=2755281 RepID=A0AA38MEI4_9CUCU|nr:hypothetical protein Zmor_012731 [Zophobas morio]
MHDKWCTCVYRILRLRATLHGNIKFARSRPERKNGKRSASRELRRMCGQTPGSAFTDIGLLDGGSPQVKHDIVEKLYAVRGPPGTVRRVGGLCLAASP